MARRGAAGLSEPSRRRDAGARRPTTGDTPTPVSAEGGGDGAPARPVRPTPARPVLRADAAAAVRRGRAGTGPRDDVGPEPLDREPLPGRRPEPVPLEVRLPQLLGDVAGRRAADRVRTAAAAFQAERFPDAARSLRPIVDRAPGVAELRELYGLTLYRLGKWQDAATHLEAFRSLAGTAEQHPVLADCYRALGRWRDVDVLWEELREASPDAATVTEGRIVAAAALADRGRLQDALRLLEAGWKAPVRPQDHHLRRAYALADLYERLGALARARELFGWVVRHRPDFADAGGRLAALR